MEKVQEKDVLQSGRNGLTRARWLRVENKEWEKAGELIIQSKWINELFIFKKFHFSKDSIEKGREF